LENSLPEPIIKDRLVVRGFEDKSDVPTDSPTASKDSTQTFFAIATTKQWASEMIHIKSAFLQEDGIEQDLPEKQM